MAAISTFSDEFPGTSVDTSKWTVDDRGKPADIAVAGGNLELIGDSDNLLRGLFTVNTYDFTGSYVVANIADFGTGTVLQTELHAPKVFFTSNGQNTVYWERSQTNITPTYSVAGVITHRTGVALNTTNHKYLRVRESGGTIYWDYSADGSSWTNYDSMAKDASWTLTAAQVALYATNFSTNITFKIAAINPAPAGQNVNPTTAAATSAAAAPTPTASASPTAQRAIAVSAVGTPVTGIAALPLVAAAVSSVGTPTVTASGTGEPASAAAVSTVGAPSFGGNASVTAQVAAAVSGVGTIVIAQPGSVYPATAAARSNALSPAFSITANAPAQVAAAHSSVGTPTITTNANPTPFIAAAVSAVGAVGPSTTGGATGYASSEHATYTNATSVTVGKPDGLAVGDLMLMVVTADRAPITATAPGGQVLLDENGVPVTWSDGTSVTIDDGTGWKLLDQVTGTAGGGSILYDEVGAPVLWSDGTPVMVEGGASTLLDELGAQVTWSDGSPVRFDNGAAQMTSWLWWKRATASDVTSGSFSVDQAFDVPLSGPPTITVSFDQAANGVAIVARFAGEDPATPLDVVVYASGVSQDAQTAPAVVTSAPNDLVVRVGTWSAAGVTVPPAGHTERDTIVNPVAGQAAIATQNTFASTPGLVAAADYLNGQTSGWTHWTVGIAQPATGDRSVTLPGAVRAVSLAPRPSLTASGNPTPLTAAAHSTVGGGAAPTILGVVATPQTARAISTVPPVAVGGGGFGVAVTVHARGAHAWSRAARAYAYWRPPKPTPTTKPTVDERNIGCGQWVAMLCDPMLRPIRRLRIRTGKVDWRINSTGQAQLTFKPLCEAKNRLGFVLGWHHLVMYRTDWPTVPLWAGRVLKCDELSGDLAAEDLSAWLGQRVVMEAGIAAGIAADPTLWVDRMLADANRQGMLPIKPVRYGATAAVEVKLQPQAQALLSSVLSDLQRFGLTWTMHGPFLRFGIGNTGPPGILLTRRHFHRLRFEVSANVVTQVIAVGSNGQIGTWPPSQRTTPPTGVVTVTANELSNAPALTRVAQIHFEQLTGPSINIAGQQLARKAQIRVRDLIPGRRFLITDDRSVLTAQVQGVSVTLAGKGYEQAVTVDMAKADDSMIRRA